MTDNEATPNIITDKSPKSEKIHFRTFIFYGIGALSNGWAVSAIGFFVLFYTTSIVGMEPSDYTVISIVTQVINAVSDPIIGVWSDRVKTRFGRRRPFILASSVLMGLFYGLFFTKIEISNRFWLVVYYQVMFAGFYLAQTCFNVPHIALVMELTEQEQTRNKFVAFSAFFFSIGNLLGPVTLLAAEKNLFSDKAMAYAAMGGITAVVMALCILTVFFGLKEREMPKRVRSIRQVLSEAISVMKYKSYLYLTMAYISVQIAIQALQFNLRLYIEHVVKMDFLMVTMVTAIVSSIVFVFPLKFAISKFGKRVTWMTSMFFFAIPFIIVIAYVPKGLVGKVVLVFVAILSGFGTAAGFYLSSCMLNDVIVEDYIKTKNNREGAFSSIFIFFQKVSVGCAHGLTGLIIQWSGTVTKKPDGSFAKEQPKSIINAIRYGASVLPLFSVLCCIFWLYLYPLTKEKVQSNQEKINEMRKV